MGKLDGTVALISGGARGQGEAEARLFAREGCAVVLGDVLDDDGRMVAESIIDAGGQAGFVHLDVTSEANWSDAVHQAVSQFGGLNILINNAGILQPGGLIERSSLDDYRRIIEVNQIGVWLGIRAAIPPMKESGGGAIINTSSTAGLEGYTGAGAYVSSKFAVRGLTKVAALELARYNIRVNSVHPGPIDTPMLSGETRPRNEQGDINLAAPIARFGRADEVAKMMLFIAADATYSTGSEFVIDGGLTSAYNVSS